jgi:hypothetical protein
MYLFEVTFGIYFSVSRVWTNYLVTFSNFRYLIACGIYFF